MPTLVLAIGALLGFVNQQAGSTSPMLRVPALIAALILVAQGTLQLQRARSGEAPPADHDAVRVSVPGDEAELVETNESGSSSQIMMFVMFLAIWLGLASLLHPDAPSQLLLLSLVAAFLLFSEAYRTLRG